MGGLQISMGGTNSRWGNAFPLEFKYCVSLNVFFLIQLFYIFSELGKLELSPDSSPLFEDSDLDCCLPDSYRGFWVLFVLTLGLGLAIGPCFFCFSKIVATNTIMKP